MNFWTFLVNTGCAIAVAQSIFLGIYLFNKNGRKTSTPIFFLSIVLLSLGCRIGKSFFFYAFENYVQLGKAIGAAGVWAIGPSFLLFVLSSKPVKISIKHYLNYLPPFTILVLWGGLGLPMDDLYLLGAVSLLLYYFYSIYVYQNGVWEGNVDCFNLFRKCIGVLCLVFIFQATIMNIQVYAIGAVLSLIVFYTITFLILSDQHKYLKSNSTKAKVIDEARLNLIIGAVQKLLEQEKIYKQRGLTLASVSQVTSFPSYQISKAINHHFDSNFNQFINKYRIMEALSLLQDLKANKKIEVIAKEVGFSSTSSFYTAFKKEMNMTPQVFRNQQKPTGV